MNKSVLIWAFLLPSIAFAAIDTTGRAPFIGNNGSRVEILNSMLGRLVIGKAERYFEYKNENNFLLVSWTDGTKSVWQVSTDGLVITALSHKGVVWTRTLSPDEKLANTAFREYVRILLTHETNSHDVINAYLCAKTRNDIKQAMDLEQKLTSGLLDGFKKLSGRYPKHVLSMVQTNSTTSNFIQEFSKTLEKISRAMLSAYATVKE